MVGKLVGLEGIGHRVEYASDGYTVLDSLQVDLQYDLDYLAEEFRQLANRVIQATWYSLHDPCLLNWFIAHPQDVTEIYDAAKQLPQLNKIAEKLLPLVEDLAARPLSIIEKKPFRIDLPKETKELAHWHQDYHYIKDQHPSTKVVCAWIPLQDVSWQNGCLSVMPGTHGKIVEHDMKMGKKQVPSGIFGNTVKYVEMKRGEVLLFNTLLLHSGNMNWSDKIRYSIQIRFEPI